MANGDRKVQSLQKKMMALQLRLAGAQYDAIAQQLGYASRSGAHRAVMTALKETLREPADELRQLELSRLEALLLGVWNGARSGNPQLVMCALKIMERIDKLFGIDTPDKLEISTRLDVSELSDEELLRIVHRLEGHMTRSALTPPIVEDEV